MPVYKKHKLVHIHIPKTAGTILGKYFDTQGDMSWGQDCWVGEVVRDEVCYEYQHLTMSELMDFSAGEFKWFHSFAVIRNPYTRLISDFYWRSNISELYPDSGIRKMNSFKAFVHSVPVNINTSWTDLIRDKTRGQANLLIHVRPQYQFVMDENGQRLVDEFLSFEKLGPDFARLLARFNQSTEIIKPPRLKTVTDYFDRETLDRVNQIYRRDFDLGGYEML